MQIHCEKLFIFDFTLLFLFVFDEISLIHGKVVDVNPVPSLHLSQAALKSFLTRVLQQNASMRACPAPKFPLQENDCTLPHCQNDEDCPSKEHSCCFNGCIFTCMERLLPPPVIDWVEEPKLPAAGKDGEMVIRCAITPRPAPSEPVTCPKGYVCKLDSAATYSSDNDSLPTTLGICVPEVTEPDIEDEPEKETGIKEKTGKQTVYLPGGCVLSEMQYRNVQDFKKSRPYIVDCFCVEGSIECQINGEVE